MQVTDLGSRETGKIWHRKPTPATNDGVIASVVHGAAAHLSPSPRFLQVAFDSAGDCFLAGDHLGNIYLFNLNRNRFDLVQRTTQACTALAFNLHRKSEFLVALADYSVKCFDTDTKELVSWMRGHESTVTSISIHGSGRYAVTTSSDTAQLWDLDTFQRKRKLNVRQSVGIQKVFFLPFSNTILSCFKDDSIFAWESDTLSCKYQLPVPEDDTKLKYKTFAITRDGRMLAAGGKSNNVHLWCLDSKQLFRIIQMPTKVRSVRQLEFLPDNFDGGSSQICMRERETATVIQDVEVREMELEAQRRFFEQQLAKEHETAAREVKGEVDANRRKAELEDQMFWRLLETEDDLKDQKLLEESMAKADRLYIEADWKIQALQKQKSADLDRGRSYAEVAKQNEDFKEKERELYDVIKDMETRKWAEVSARRTQLEAERLEMSALETRRKPLLQARLTPDMEMDIIQDEGNEYFERLRDLKLGVTEKNSRQCDKDVPDKPVNPCLNDVSSETSTHFSLDRGRGDLESRERVLMSEVRDLRQKLASQGRRRYPTSYLSDTQWT
ncbi:TBC1 domain family member 31 [Bombina bombina]|uniref:TBC1 domain family member 31 n=1 Tax=Bombina bombina TaxID=8345 RepID=UPI00235ADF2A|nr:TBC1 domain family member 31 [Bombina bombina]